MNRVLHQLALIGFVTLLCFVFQLLLIDVPPVHAQGGGASCENLPTRYESTHFRICFDMSKTPIADAVTLAQNFENAWDWFVADGYTMPDLQGDKLTVFAADDLQLKCPIDFLGDNDRGVSLPGRIWIPQGSMNSQKLAVHELFHSVQWSYSGHWDKPSCRVFIDAYLGPYQRDGWWYESNAMWMEFYQAEQGRYAGPADGYWRSLRKYFEDVAQGLLDGWRNTLGAARSRAYGEAIFSRYLELTSGPKIIENIWSNASNNLCNSLRSEILTGF